MPTSLRQRKQAAAIMTPSKHQKAEEGQQAADKSTSDGKQQAGKGRDSRLPRQQLTTPRKSLSIAIAVLVAFALYLSTSGKLRLPSLGLRSPRPLPSRYAVCSRRRQQQIITSFGSAHGDKETRTECIVVEQGKVVSTGTLDEVRRQFGDEDTRGRVTGGVKIFYLKKGQTLIPGLIDAHAHVLQNGEAASAVDLVGSQSLQETIDRIARYIEADPSIQKDKSRFILGLGWDQTRWPVKVFPTADDLENDSRLRGRPIYLKRIDVHALWVSQKIIDSIKHIPDTVDGGLVVRLPSGKPSGVFVDNAMSLPLTVIPKWTDEQRLKYLSATAREMLSHGLTSVHDAALSTADVAFLRRLDENDQMPVRIYGLLACDPLNSYCGDQVEKYDRKQRFALKAVKIFTDGALGSWGAAMHEDYSDKPGEKGIMISPEEHLQEWIRKGFQVCSHAIGDRANTVVMDAYENATKNLSRSIKDLRLRIEHAQIMTPADIARAGRLGAISSVQPTHCTSDMGYAEARLGPERIKGAYAWRSLQASGSPLALGSDFPVEKVSPFLGIYSAVSRKWLDGDSPHGRKGWYSAESLDRLTTLRGFTTDAAFAAFQEDQLGSLEVGKEADFVVLDRDLVTVPESEIPSTEVRATIVGGTLMYGRLG
ncbi:hypothetical protein OIO90_003862 [Microbotryomycetes sp. JL221]|nr:hypothetical protein OIO90_003862 [Microbotryomycetes sp. JL221]